jgi:uncharacterized protein YjbI with pentapeptide repeats
MATEKNKGPGCSYVYRHGMWKDHRCNLRPLLKDGQCILHSKLHKNFDLLKNFFNFLQSRVQAGGSLEGAVLREAELQGIQLAGALLQDADLTGCRLTQARLTKANLSGAKLVNADLSGVNLREAVLSHTRLDQAFFIEANLEGADLSMASLAECDLEGATLTNANLENAILNKANLFGATLINCNLAGASLLDANLECANVSNCNLRHANLTGTQVNALTIYAGVKNLNTTIRPPEEWAGLTDQSGSGSRPSSSQTNRSMHVVRPVGRLLPDDVFGDEQEYRIIRRLGKGGSAFVYLIEDRSDPNIRIKALKILDPNLGAEEINVKRFRREGVIGKKLIHPNVIRVFDVKYTKPFDTFYLVMDYIDGPDLKQYLKRYAELNKPFPAKIGIQIVYQLCQGMHFVHSKGIVHRDLKPGNVLIRKNGRLVITDFGLSKITGTVEQTLYLATNPGTLLGTFEYMSPEQVIGEEVTHSTDIYAMGVIMYEMFVGRLPYKAHNVLGWVNVIRNSLPPPPSKVNPYFPAWLEAIIMRCLEKDSRKRFQSVKDLLEAVRQRS